MTKEDIANAFESIQDQICIGLEKADGKGSFKQDDWERSGGGGGKTRIMSNGQILEKGGVNFSKVFGPTPEKILQALSLTPADFFATGVSLVIHPFNPHIPMIHMNVRYFHMSNGVEWFGGGIDLTPHYVVTEQAQFFHQEIKKVCDRHHPDFYGRFKKWADDYFYIPHRKETRGIGGIFFDRLSPGSDLNLTDLFEFSQDVAQSLVPIYSKLIQQNKDQPYSDGQKDWQLIRRGRYAEFNLVYDKGTKFGLDTQGRTESILMSLPPLVRWHYDYRPEAGSQEFETVNLLKKGIDWVSIQQAKAK